MKDRLYTVLSSIIRGEISIHFTNGMLIVDISRYGVNWRYTTRNYRNHISLLEEEIIIRYQDYIFDLFFNTDIDNDPDLMV